MAEQLKIVKCKNGQFRFKVYNDNPIKPENLATSEQFTQKHNATEGFDALAIACMKILNAQGRLGFALAQIDLLELEKADATAE